MHLSIGHGKKTTLLALHVWNLGSSVLRLASVHLGSLHRRTSQARHKKGTGAVPGLARRVIATAAEEVTAGARQDPAASVGGHCDVPRLIRVQPAGHTGNRHRLVTEMLAVLAPQLVIRATSSSKKKKRVD